ncbi:MAG TPA: choice-of-anchor G family protein [Ruania sp.]|nr:choice-of-anchor G family protein [Ruania sp.]
MKPRQKSAHTTVRAQWRKPLAIATASVAAVALGAVGLSGPLAPASAAQSDDSEAEGRLLTGGGVVNLNDIAELAGAYSAHPSAPGVVDDPLSLEVLNSLDLDLGDGLQLFGENGVIGLGALGQYGSTAEDEVPLASSGLVNADGSIAVGGGDPGENAYVDLTPLLDEAGLTDLLSEARVELGALSALATVDENGDPVGDYQIASGTLNLTSPAVAGLSDTLSESLDQVSGPINDLAGEGGVIDETLDPLLSGLADTLNAVLLGLGSVEDLGVTATVDLDLQAALDSVLGEPLTSEDSAVTIDLSTGAVSVDLARLVADTQGGDYDGTLNGLPPNTEVLGPDAIQAALDGAIGSTLDQIPALVVEAVTDALHAADVTIGITGDIRPAIGPSIGTVDVQLSGTLGDFLGVEGAEDPVVDTSDTSIIGLPVGDLVEPLIQAVTDTFLPALVQPLSEAITDEGTLDTIFRPAVEGLNELLSPLAAGITENLVSLTANVQETPGDFVNENGYDEGSFTERALQLTLLPNDPLVQLSLASATVRVQADDQDADTDADAAADPDAAADDSADPDAAADDSADPDASADDSASDDTQADANTNASASAAASATADDDSNAAAEAAAQAAADADADDAASAEADASAAAAAQAAANEDASSDATADVEADANASAAAAAQAAANDDASSDANAAASADESAQHDSDASAESNSAAAAEAAATADSSSAASADATADANADASSDAQADDATADDSADATADDSADATADTEADANTNASASAAASANADDDSNASAEAAAQAAANADTSSAASADADVDATAAAASAADADASAEAAADVDSDANAAAAAAAQASADADNTASTNADASAAAAAQADADANAAAAAAAEAASTADSSSAASADASSAANGAGGAGNGSDLPDTGANLNPGLLVGGLLLVLVGGGLAVVARLRRDGRAG